MWVDVRKAVDGDTLRLKDGRLVRLIGIDSPEIDHKHHLMQPLADKAMAFLANITAEKKVRLEIGVQSHDRHHRLLAYVYDTNGRLINQLIVANGFAYVLYVKPNIEKHQLLLASQRKAMAAKKGIWEKVKYRKSTFIGNQNSRRFHLSECPMAAQIHKKNIITFNSNQEAFHAGYAPCKRCLPVPKNRKLRRN